jgi:lysozyme family protein
MADFETYRAGYEKNWGALQIRPGRQAEATKEAQRLFANRGRYKEVERWTGVPWWFVGLCHYRESHYNFTTYLGNGQPLNRKTTIVPVGRGPFATFEEGAIDALTQQQFVGLKDWSLPRAAYRLEGFNGYGYHAKGVNSPYLYGGSTCYGPPEAKAGKYVRDHVFDPNFVDPQLGTLVILKALMALDHSINIGPPSNVTPLPVTPKPPTIPPPPDIEAVPPKPASPPPPGIWATFWKNFTKRG